MYRYWVLDLPNTMYVSFLDQPLSRGVPQTSQFSPNSAVLSIGRRRQPWPLRTRKLTFFSAVQHIMLIKTSAEILREGLELVGFNEQRQARVSNSTNRDRFKEHYGSSPVVCARIWDDLQTTTIPEARVDVKRDKELEYFLQAQQLLTMYTRENQRSGTFGNGVRSNRDWSWYFIKKIAALKALKVSVRSLSREMAALAHDRKIHPKRAHNDRGEPRWEGSEAERLLQQDVKDGKDKTMKPHDLWFSHEEYQKYPKDVFRGHIYQERRCQKFLHYVKNKNNP